MIKEVKSWRQDFGITTPKDAAKNMLEEEYLEAMAALEEFDDWSSDEKRLNNLKKELADLFFVLVQVAESYGIDLQESVRKVLESNYTKRMTMEEFSRLYQETPSECVFKVKDGFVYMYNNSGKLMKPLTYKDPVW